MKDKVLSILYKIYKLKEDLLAKLFLKQIKLEKTKNKKLLIVRPDAIGDYILFRNFLEIIKKNKKYKGYEIHLLGNMVWKNIFENIDSKGINKTTFLNLREMYHGGNKYRQKILNQIGENYFDTIIYPAYSRNSIIDILISKLKAKNKIAFSGNSDNMTYFEKIFTDKIYTKLIKSNQKFEFDRNREFFEQVLEEKINLSNPKINIKKKQLNYFVINPGASVKFRQWKPENFAKVIDHLVEKYKSKIYIVGSKAELELDKKVRELSKHKNKIKIKNGGDLFDLLKLIAESRGIVSNETCTSHMAVALDKKVYCIAGKLGHERMHPYPNYEKATYFYPYDLKEIKESNYWGGNLDKITVEEVIPKL
jgi:ADP-heptose:LPS heptosyltransferase